MARMPPLMWLAVIAGTLIAKFTNILGTLDWIQAIAIGLIAGGIVGFIFNAGKKTAPILIILGLIGWFAAPQLATGISAPKELSVATFSVTPAAVTSGVQISGDNFIVPLTLNTTSNTLDKDPIEVQFTVVRTDTGTQDAAFKVECQVNGKVTDDATGLQYDYVEKNALGKYDIEIIDTSDNSTVVGERTFAMPFGTTSKVIKIRINLNPVAYKYADLYESLPITCKIAGTTSQIFTQKVGEVA